VAIDLHTHSTASDGRSTPAELVAEAAAAGLSVLALTDHDTFAGLGGARAAAGGTPVRVLSGVEISTRTAGMSVHLLGYGDCLIEDPALAAALSGTVASRADRATEMARKIAAGEGLDEESLLSALAANTPPGATPGRPHLADALIQLGRIGNRDEAFTVLLSESGPYYAHYRAPSTASAVATVAAAGGLAVIAHPNSAHGPGVLSNAQISDLTMVGLAGLEVDHRDHDDSARANLRGLAKDLDLLVTGSSDYHGSGKSNALGENATAPEVFEEMSGRLADRW